MTYTPQAKERMVEKNFWGNNNYLYCLPIELYLELTRFSLTGQAQLALAIKEQSLNHPTTLPDKQLSLELPFTPSYSLLTAFDDSNTKIIQLLNRFNEPPRCLVIAIETSKILNQFDTDEASIATCNKKGNYLAIGIQDKKTRIPRVTVYNIDNGTLLHKFSLDFKSKIYNMLFLNNNILRTEIPLEQHPLSSVSVKDWDIHTGKPVYEKIIQANKTFFIGPIKITHNVGFSSPLLRRGFYHSDALTITFDRTPHSKIKIDRPNQQDPLDYFIETRDAPYWCMPNTQESMYALVKHCEAGIHYAKSEVRDLRASRILALFDTKPDVGSLPAFSHDSRYIAICNHGANS